MPKRYEKIEFKNFSGGKNPDNFIRENGFGDNLKIEVKKDRLTLANNFSSFTTEAIDCDHSLEVHNGEAYQINNGKVLKWNGSGFTLLATPALAPWFMISVDEKLFFTGPSNNLAILNTAGTGFTTIGGAVASLSIASYGNITKGANGWLYGIFNNGTTYKLLKSNDNFFTTTDVFDFRTNNFVFGTTMNLNGLIYFIHKNSIMRVVNDKVETVITFENRPTFAPQSKDYAIIATSPTNNKTSEFFYFNGFTVEKLKDVSGGSLTEVTPFFDGNYTYWTILNTDSATYEIYTVYKINKNGDFFKVFEVDAIASGYAPWTIRKLGGKVFIDTSASDQKWRVQQDTYESTGYIDSGVINKGEHAPAVVNIRHEPLPANTSIKLYVKKDRASAGFGSSVLTNAVAGSVLSSYAFPALYGKVSFMELRVELLTSDTSKTPSDVEFSYLFTPVGIENSI